MITRADEERLLVISDLHLGNPFCRAKREVVAFLDYAAHMGCSVCINGDGLDIAQTSFTRISAEAPEVFGRFSRIADAGGRVYYVIGNHDIVLEHFFETWGFVQLVPFLNVHSGGRRIRIEHGHLYDPFFISNPRLYEFGTAAAGLLLKVYPPAYRLWVAIEKLRGRARSRHSTRQGIEGEHQHVIEAVEELIGRGFDTVIFGHTHHLGQVDLGRGRSYIHTGSWMLEPAFAEIAGGRVALRRWPDDKE